MRCKNELKINHSRFVDPEVETSMCLMAEGPPGFEAAFAAALPEMLQLLIVLDYGPPVPDHAEPRGWWGEGGKVAGPVTGNTVQADARAAFSSGDVTAAGCRSLSRAWVSE